MSGISPYDLLIIGGGVNGAGIARDAAGRGLRVLLAEMGDLASATSSASSKMIHGGLRYLETYQFKLVREALHEREVLLRIAPHLIRPMRFLLPHVPSMRPKWMLRAGLFLYDHLAGPISVPRSGATPLGPPLKAEFSQGFHYSDAVVEDARLVVLNAVSAAQHGAVIKTYTKVEALWPEGGLWQVRLGGEVVSARVVVNAAGPWVGEALKLAKPAAAAPVRLIKGSHLVVPRMYEGDHAYLCQNDDGRVVFFWPYERDFTLIGTTDVPYTGDPAQVSCSDEEVEYLLKVAGRYFSHPPTSLSIVQKFAGVRSLYDDGKANAKDITRDYVLNLEQAPLPLLSVFGGKITTYRHLAETALAKLLPYFPEMKPAWTATVPLPGGDLGQSRQAFEASVLARFPWLGNELTARWCRLYGTRLLNIIGHRQSLHELGAMILPGLYEAEVNYLRSQEFARTADDILWRRTKLGLRFGRRETETLALWLARG